MKTFQIDPVGPYSLEESAQFVGGWVRPSENGSSAAGHLHLAFLTDADWMPVGVCLTQNAGGAVQGEVFGDAEVEAVQRQVARILSLDVDGRGWSALAERDPVVATLQLMFPGFRPVNWSDAYEAAAWCILSSRITMRQAQGVKDRLCRELGHELSIHGHDMWTFPTPQRLARLESFPGLFGRKVEYLRALARAALAGELDTDRLRALPADQSLAALRRLAGIGEFGSQLVRLRALSAVDELPTAEPRLAAAVRTAYGPEIELVDVAGGWSPYTMWVCVCLRRATGGTGSMVHSRASG